VYWHLQWVYQQSYSTLGAVSTGMGDHILMDKSPTYATSYPGQLSLLP